MARRTSITSSLGDVPQEEGPADQQQDTTQQQEQPKKPRGGGSKRQNSGSKNADQPAEGRTQKKPTLRTASTSEAKRISLYVHPDDFRELGLAKLDDGADANARFRAMLALWRDNERFRKQVDRLARSAPRGPGSNS